MLTEAILAAIVEAVFGYALEQSGLADHVRSALGRDPAKRAFARAMDKAFDETCRQFPASAARLFDISFLQHEAAPVLAQLLWRHGRPSADDLAAAWADSLRLQGASRGAGLDEMTPVAELFLGVLESEAKKEGPLDDVFDRRAREATAEHTAVLPEMRDILREMTAAPARPPVPLRTSIPDRRSERLVGRVDELSWLCQRLKAGDVAAIAGVRGIGGIGKTELAIAAARELEGHFEGRVIWLDCGPNDASAIQERMAAAVGAALDSADLRVRADALALALRQQPPTLVVLDDVRRRHLADFRCIAPPRPPCALLITSRRDDLPLPRGAVRALGVLEPEQSLELLAALLPAGWLAAEEPAAAEIAGLLEHIPLALTLAARRAERIAARGDDSARHPLATLLAELRERRLQVLNQGEDPDRPDLSVVITFDASYDDLDPADQARLRRLGVFARNEFELPALMAVWGDDEAPARLALERLVNAGLLEEAAQDAWRMHDLLREYAAGRLGQADPGEEHAARLAHAGHWQRFLGALQLRGADDWRALEAHRPEVEGAAHWLLADWGGAPKLAAELAVAISRAFQWYALPRWAEWLRSGQRAAEACGQRNLACMLQRSLGWYLWQRGETAQAGKFLEASLATARELLEAAVTDEDVKAGRHGVAVTLGDIARLKAPGGDVAGTLALHRERLEVYERLGDVRSRAVTLGDIARLKAQGGDVAGALALHRERLEILDGLGDVRSRAVTQYDLADLLRRQGEYAEAERLYRDSLAISRRIGDAEGTFALLARLGVLALEQGRPEEALPLLQEARRGFEDMGFAPWVSHLDRLLAAAGATS